MSAMPCGFEESLLDFESGGCMNVLNVGDADAGSVAGGQAADDWVVEVADFDTAAALKSEVAASHIITTG